MIFVAKCLIFRDCVFVKALVGVFSALNTVYINVHRSHNCRTVLMNRQHNTPRTHHCTAQLTLHTGAGLSWAGAKFNLDMYGNSIKILAFKGQKPTTTELQHEQGLRTAAVFAS